MSATRPPLALPVVRRDARGDADDEPAAPEPEGELAHELALPHDDAAIQGGALLYNAVGLRVEPGRVVDYDAGDAHYARGEEVVHDGPGQARVAIATRRILSRERLPRVLRRASDVDVNAEAQLRAREQALTRRARAEARSLGLPLKVVRSEALQGGQRFAIYFASEKKIVYRELLRALATASKERVELRPIGPREAARISGGVGPCGLQLCCNTFLADFTPVHIGMARDQGLGQSPTKVSGVCGRLLCCLVYEEAQYRALRPLVPRIGDRVETTRGRGRVRDVDVLDQRVRVLLESGGVVTLTAADVQSLETHPPDSDREADDDELRSTNR